MSQFDVRKLDGDSFALTIVIRCAHIDDFDHYMLMLDASLGRGIEKLKLKAASGNREAMKVLDGMRAMQRYIGDISGALAFAREINFSQSEGNDDAKS